MMSNYPVLRRLVGLLSLIVFSVTMVAFARAYATPNAIVEPGDFPTSAVALNAVSSLEIHSFSVQRSDNFGNLRV